jgi:hypothetical protein
MRRIADSRVAQVFPERNYVILLCEKALISSHERKKFASMIYNNGDGERTEFTALPRSE